MIIRWVHPGCENYPVIRTISNLHYIKGRTQTLLKFEVFKISSQSKPTRHRTTWNGRSQFLTRVLFQ